MIMLLVLIAVGAELVFHGHTIIGGGILLLTVYGMFR